MVPVGPHPGLPRLDKLQGRPGPESPQRIVPDAPVDAPRPRLIAAPPTIVAPVDPHRPDMPRRHDVGQSVAVGTFLGQAPRNCPPPVLFYVPVDASRRDPDIPNLVLPAPRVAALGNGVVPVSPVVPGRPPPRPPVPDAGQGDLVEGVRRPPDPAVPADPEMEVLAPEADLVRHGLQPAGQVAVPDDLRPVAPLDGRPLGACGLRPPRPTLRPVGEGAPRRVGLRPPPRRRLASGVPPTWGITRQAFSEWRADPTHPFTSTFAIGRTPFLHLVTVCIARASWTVFSSRSTTSRTASPSNTQSLAAATILTAKRKTRSRRTRAAAAATRTRNTTTGRRTSETYSSCPSGASATTR